MKTFSEMYWLSIKTIYLIHLVNICVQLLHKTKNIHELIFGNFKFAECSSEAKHPNSIQLFNNYRPQQ